jgi:hypothetical protein
MCVWKWRRAAFWFKPQNFFFVKNTQRYVKQNTLKITKDFAYAVYFLYVREKADK